ncbi:NAD-dependent epimerase [Grosmannia clavigera kw1407]|uniref:NAD-dependent epimerase n=1 Tax=Grosmannia clavigera (strain kw1407 / UAMH 11150) TaxID=655863 RepID=F0XGJ3_GROCL|nr:NAD-dependent epimerase [Grosmannia clavigera kw1407]EFX02673.1 NAD-dependent epimerase [Grosmannia clavigera kw1407]
METRTYAVVGSTGNCGTALIENLWKRDNSIIHAYCRNRAKLLQKLPFTQGSKRVAIFEGGIDDVPLMVQCVTGCRAIFLVVSTNDNIPGCSLGQDTAKSLITALCDIKDEITTNPNQNGSTGTLLPKIVLLSSSTLDDHLSRHLPPTLRRLLVRAASHVYNDLAETEKLLRAEKDWLTSLYAMPGALSVDIQRDHAISLTDHDGPLSYLDLAAAMIEAVDDEAGQAVTMAQTSTREIQAATLQRFIEGWASWTPEGFLDSWSDNCTQQNLPFCQNSPVKTRETVVLFFPILMSILTNFKLKVHNIVHESETGKAAIYAQTTADSPWGPYQNEYALFLWFDKTGEKVQNIEELFDTIVMDTFLPKIQACTNEIMAKKKRAAASGTNPAVATETAVVNSTVGELPPT